MKNTPRYQLEREIAIRAAIKASKLCRHVQENLSEAGTISKIDKSPVTIADFGSQAIINSEILKHFPDDKIIGEEDSSKLKVSPELLKKVTEKIRKVEPELKEDEILNAIDMGNAIQTDKGRVWAIDPIDGTKGFLRGEQYAIAISLLENGRVVLGVLGCPNLPDQILPGDSLTLTNQEGRESAGCIIVAVRDEGTFIRNYNASNETEVRVSGITDTSKAWLVESVEPAHSSHETILRISQQLGITRASVRLDSQAKYAIIARGDAPIYLRIPRGDYREKIWDHAAGSIIVEEAGGKVTDIYGKPLDFTVGNKLILNSGIVATNGLLHQNVITAINSTLKETS